MKSSIKSKQKESRKRRCFIIDELKDELFKMKNKLNKEILFEGCKGKEKKIDKLTDKCENQEMARFFYDCELNATNYDHYIRWIPFNDFEKTEYLTKGSSGEVRKANWI